MTTLVDFLNCRTGPAQELHVVERIEGTYEADKIRNMLILFVVEPLNSFVLFDNTTQRELTTMK